MLGSLLALGGACGGKDRQFEGKGDGGDGADPGGSPSVGDTPSVGGSSASGDGGAAGGTQVGTAGEGGAASSGATGAGGEGLAPCDAPATCAGNAVVSCLDGVQTTVPCDGDTPICQEGACVTPPSCASLKSDCGADGDASCCTSPVVTGGKFFRSYDGSSTGYQDKSFPAVVSDFRLDQFEVTVGRFRRFVAAWVGGWRPASGAGKHAHISEGSGITLSAGGHELGWSNEWLSPASANYAAIPSTLADWNTALASGTWTPSAEDNENLPVTTLTWYESYAFCIWDGGFLPTEAEWNYAAAGGNQQRVYPWGATAPGNDTSLANYNCLYGPGNCNADGSVAPVGNAAAGIGRYGHLDLAGNVREWILDFHADYETSCTDCAQLAFAQARGYRGGSFYDPADNILASHRESYPPTYRSVRVGARCARSP